MTAQTDWEETARRLRDISHGGGAIEAAQVSVLGLHEIRRAAGPLWPRLRARVREGSLAILSQHMGENDLAIPAGDGFLIVFADGRSADIAARCAAMRGALLAFYLGEEALKSLRPELEACLLTPEGVAAFFATSAERELDAAPPPAPPARIALAPLFATNRGRTAATLAAPLLFGGRPWRMGYDPNYLIDGEGAPSASYLDLDLALLDAALAQLAEESVVGVCVHASTLRARKSREAYLAQLRAVDAGLRPRLIGLIAEIERGAPLSAIEDWTISLRGLVGQVWLEFHHRDNPLSGIGAIGATAACFQLPRLTPGGGERLREQVAAWARTLHLYNMRLFVSAFHDRAFLERALCDGVDFAASDALWPFTERSGAAAHRQAL